MSNFEPAIVDVLKHEGFYVNDPNDTGGATNFGVSLRWLKGLGELEGDINHDGEVDIEDIRSLQKSDAIRLYRIHWWDKYQYEKINHQLIATKAFDFAVNMGSQQAHKCLQRAVRAVTGSVLVEDGIFGAQSFQAINTCPPLPLLAAYRSETAGFYRALNKPRYLEGWLNRAYS